MTVEMDQFCFETTFLSDYGLLYEQVPKDLELPWNDCTTSATADQQIYKKKKKFKLKKEEKIIKIF